MACLWTDLVSESYNIDIDLTIFGTNYKELWSYGHRVYWEDICLKDVLRFGTLFYPIGDLLVIVHVMQFYTGIPLDKHNHKMN